MEHPVATAEPGVHTGAADMCPHSTRIGVGVSAASPRPSPRVAPRKDVGPGPSLPQAAWALAAPRSPAFRPFRNAWAPPGARSEHDPHRRPGFPRRHLGASRWQRRGRWHSLKQLDFHRAIALLYVPSSLPKGTPGLRAAAPAPPHRHPTQTTQDHLFLGEIPLPSTALDSGKQPWTQATRRLLERGLPGPTPWPIALGAGGHQSWPCHAQYIITLADWMPSLFS